MQSQPGDGQVRAEGRAFGALWHRDFRLFWGGSIISQVGNWMRQVAQAWLVYDLTGSALLLGLTGLFQSVPFIAMSFYAGTVVDRVDRRKLLIWIESINLVLTLILAVLVVTGLVQVWHIYAHSAAQALVGAFESPARQALVPHLVPRQDLMTAISLNSIQRKGAQIIGPAIGGILVASFGVAGAYFIQAAMSPLLLGSLVLMRATNPWDERAHEHPLRAIADGIRYVWSEQVIFALILVESFLSLFGSYHAMMVVFAREVFEMGPEGLGFLQSAAGLGSVVGSLVLASVGDVHRKGRLLMASGLVYATALLGFAFCPWFLLALPLLALAGAADILFGATRTTIIQLLARRDMLGRVSSLAAISMRGLGPSGGFVSGGLTTLFGSVQLATALGALACIALIAGAGWRVPLVSHFVGSGPAREARGAPRPPAPVQAP